MYVNIFSKLSIFQLYPGSSLMFRLRVKTAGRKLITSSHYLMFLYFYFFAEQITFLNCVENPIKPHFGNKAQLSIKVNFMYSLLISYYKKWLFTLNYCYANFDPPIQWLIQKYINVCTQQHKPLHWAIFKNITYQKYFQFSLIYKLYFEDAIYGMECRGS